MAMVTAPSSKCSGVASVVGLIGWLLVTFCAPALGMWSMPDAWYEALDKPEWNPPAWIFGPVWTLLYTMMAVAAWRVWRHGGWAVRGRALGLYLVQLALNAAWTPLFFGWHQPGLAFLDIVLLLAAMVATGVAFARVDRLAALLWVPYVMWVGFATLLNFTLWRMNV